MADEVSVKFTTQDEAKAFAAFVRLRKETKDAGDAVAEAGTKTDRADASLRRFADNVRKVNASPIERLNAELAKLKEASDKGFLDPGEYARAVASANSRAFNAAMAPNEKAVASVREFERAQVKANDTSQREIKETAQETLKLGNVTETVADRSGRSFEGIATAAKTAFRSAAAVATVVLGEVTAAAEQAAQQIRQSAGAQGQLSQLPNAAQLRPIVEQVRRAGAAESLGEAADVVFALESAGATAERDTFVKLRAANVIASVAETVNATAALKSSMGDADVGTFTDAIAKALAAARVGKGTVEQLLEAAGGKAGTFAKEQGASSDDVLAAISVISQQTRRPDTAGEYLAAFLRETSQKDELRGKSLLDAVAAIDAQKLGPEDMAKYLGSSEGMVAFAVLRDRAAQVRSLSEEVRQAGQNSGRVIGKAVDDALSQPGQRAALAARQSEASVEMASQQIGQRKLITDALLKTVEAEVLQGNRRGPFQDIFGAGDTTRQIDAGMVRAVSASDPLLGLSVRSIPGVDALIRGSARRSPNEAIRRAAEVEQGVGAREQGERDRDAMRQQIEAARMMREAAQTMRDAAREQRESRSSPTFSWSTRAQAAQAVPAE